MKILVLNCGSSSVKYELFEGSDLSVLASGLVEKIGEETSLIRHRRVSGGGNSIEMNKETLIPDHDKALESVLEILTDEKHGSIAHRGEVKAVGHRVVHGGETFHSTTIIDEAVLAAIKENVHLAPLHNPPNLKGIEVARAIFPQAVQVAVFDTAFHHTISEKAYMYAIPYELYEKHGIRRYGFHGTSHSFVAEKAAEYLEKPLNELKLITIHLGNGASMAAIKHGKCIDTSMGMTPLEGLVMGTRSGDIDPALPFYIAEQLSMSFPEIDRLLNKKSGLKGLCGTNDMRKVVEMCGKGDRKAVLALKVYCYRIKKYLGAYIAVLGGLDAIIFTAGIGENSADVRSGVCRGLEHLGIFLDDDRNRDSSQRLREISAKKSRVKVLVVPTNEELKIATETLRALKEHKKHLVTF